MSFPFYRGKRKYRDWPAASFVISFFILSCLSVYSQSLGIELSAVELWLTPLSFSSSENFKYSSRTFHRGLRDYSKNISNSIFIHLDGKCIFFISSRTRPRMSCFVKFLRNENRVCYFSNCHSFLKNALLLRAIFPFQFSLRSLHRAIFSRNISSPATSIIITIKRSQNPPLLSREIRSSDAPRRNGRAEQE